MVSQNAHEFVSLLLLGKSYSEFHSYKDSGFSSLKIFHRLFPPHDIISTINYFLQTNDIEIFLVSFIHDLQDLDVLASLFEQALYRQY